MSYDIDLYMTVDTGGSTPVEIVIAGVGNYTSNVAGMWSDALGCRLADLNKKTAGDCVPALESAVAAMTADPIKYEAMNPANGWGDYQGARDYLARLRDACSEHPKATVHICH